ncbi:MAG: HlyC/CorC family transporter [Bacteroidales bacterium]|nr:HlyC/CorC family transporter [Bacteroidales bacterium]
MHYLIYILITLVFSAFFSGMEIAFVSSNKLRIELDKKQGYYASGIISIFIKNPSQYIATMLIGNNIALVIYGIIMAIILEPFILTFTHSDSAILIIQTIVSTLIILITAEFLPKTLFQINPNLFLNLFSIPIYFFYILFYPFTKFTIALSNTFLKSIFNVKINKTYEKTVFGKVDLDDFLESHKKEVDKSKEIKHEVKIFKNALDFSKVKLRECIVPRTEIAALEINNTIEELKQKFIETGFSKILIYEESIDHIIGYAHSSELFKNPKDIKSMMHRLQIVPETMPAKKLLSLFTNEHKSIALVVDEFGGTSGIVTIEDIMEEIFGEIVDEHDIIELEEKIINENEYLFSGRLEIDYINEKYNNIIPVSDDYETIAGYILFHHGNIPNVNDNIKINNLNFKILKVSSTRIELIELKIIEKNSKLK